MTKDEGIKNYRRISGQTLKIIRTMLGLTQTELGMLIGLTAANVSKIEKRNSYVNAKATSKIYSELNVNEDVVIALIQLNTIVNSRFNLNMNNRIQSIYETLQKDGR